MFLWICAGYLLQLKMFQEKIYNQKFRVWLFLLLANQYNVRTDYGLDSQLAGVAHGGGAGVLKLHMEGRVGIEVAHRGGLEYWSLPLASPNTQTCPMPNAVCSAIDVLCRRKWECKQVLSGMGHCWALQCASIAGSLEPCPGCLWGKYPSLSVCAMLYSSCSLLTNLQYEAQYNYNANAMQTKHKVSRYTV